MPHVGHLWLVELPLSIAFLWGASLLWNSFDGSRLLTVGYSRLARRRAENVEGAWASGRDSVPLPKE